MQKFGGLSGLPGYIEEGPLTTTSSILSTIDALVDLCIDCAPLCVEHGQILSGIDWRKVSAAKVDVMLVQLAHANMSLPPRLAKSLLLAGHALPAEHSNELPLALRALDRINHGRRDRLCVNELEQIVAVVASQPELDGDVACALVAALASLGAGSMAVRLALAHWQLTPKALRLASSEFIEYKRSLPAVELRVLGFSTTGKLCNDLVPAFAAFGYQVKWTQGDFGSAIADLLKPQDDGIDALVIQLDVDGFVAHNWRLSPAKIAALLDEKLDTLTAALEYAATTSGRPVFINTCPSPIAPIAGLIDVHYTTGVRRATDIINQRLVELARQTSQIILLDGDMAMACIAPTDRSDPKLWYYGRFPLGQDATRALAYAVARAWDAHKNGAAKVLALDLDNTLWGGVFGEDGIAGLTCGDDFPGNAFKSFQDECLRLKSQGMLLALLSKNDASATTTFAEHSGMLLREDDFVARRINWQPKPDNIRALAQELNLGLESFVFIDDSPHEREAMRQLCPEVIVPELPADPARRPLWLRNLSATWPSRLTDEDSRRSELYLTGRKASQLRTASADFGDYLSGLEQMLVVSRVNPANLSRVAQMHARTNQFNLTTRRYDVATIKGMMEDTAGHDVLLGHVKDKFGDHGIVICVVVRLNGERAELLTFLMSCRVIGREIERAFLGAVLKALTDRGITTIDAHYIATEKNSIVRDFYERSGFARQRTDGLETRWKWISGIHDLPVSNHVALEWSIQ